MIMNDEHRKSETVLRKKRNKNDKTLRSYTRLESCHLSLSSVSIKHNSTKQKQRMRYGTLFRLSSGTRGMPIKLFSMTSFSWRHRDCGDVADWLAAVWRHRIANEAFLSESGWTYADAATHTHTQCACVRACVCVNRRVCVRALACVYLNRSVVESHSLISRSSSSSSSLFSSLITSLVGVSILTKIITWPCYHGESRPVQYATGTRNTFSHSFQTV